MDQFAKIHGFCKRKRKLTPRFFLEMLLLKTHQGDQESLTDHVYELQRNRKVTIKKQSLHNQFSPSAVAFLKEVVLDKLRVRNDGTNNALFKPFSKVFIQDSTKFGLPDQLQNDYPCYGGSAAVAGGQIQFTYELKNNQICQLDLHSARRNECLSATGNNWIEQGSLVLRDLGYFKVDGFKEIINKGAFFISRAKPKTAFYYPDKAKVKFDIEKLLSQMNRHEINYCEKELVMGVEQKKKMPVRVIFCRIPDEVKAQRLRKAFKNAKERNWTVTDDYQLWAGINVFITNIPKETVSAKNIVLTYKLRWQVELIFKTWKSHYKIHLYKSVKKERIECYLYATLLLILLQTSIYSWLQNTFLKQKVSLSVHKFSKVMVHLRELFRLVILQGKHQFQQLINILISLSKSTLTKEKRKGRIGYMDILSTAYDYLYLQERKSKAHLFQSP